MAKSSTVGSRELKTRLGRYLRRVRQGETILVTDRDEPIAELRPLSDSARPELLVLRKLSAKGIVTLPTRGAPSRFEPIRSRGARATAALSKDRDERG